MSPCPLDHYINDHVHVRLYPHVPDNSYSNVGLKRVYMQQGRIIVALLVVTSVAIGPGIVAGTEDPRFEADVGSTVVTPGQPEQLSVTIVNDAEDPEDRVDAATNVEADMKPGGTPFSISSGSRHLGTLKDGRPVSTSFSIDVPRDIDSGTYAIPIELTYEYDGDERETTTVHVTVIVKDRAAFEVVAVEDSVAVGNDGSVSLTIENVGSEPAADATVRIQSKTAMVHFGGSDAQTRYIGEWDVGEARTVTYAVGTSPEAEAAAYPLIATVKFDDLDGNRQASAPLPAHVHPQPMTFDIEAVESGLQVGTDGTATFEITNTGNEAVSGVSLEVLGTGPHLDPTQRTYPVGTIEPGDTENVSVSVRTADAAAAGDREFTVRVKYDDTDGDRSSGDSRVAVVPVADRQSFDVSVIENDLRVDRDGDLTFEITNTGPKTVRNANIRIGETGPTVHPETTEYSIGTLAPGETTTARFSLDVSDGASPTPRQFTVGMHYDESDGDRVAANPQSIAVDVAPERPVFDVAITGGEVPMGETASVTVRIENTGNETLSKINAKAFTDAPVTITDDSAYIGELAPGESMTLEFGVSAPGDAQMKQYPISMDLQYTDEDGDTELTDTYDVPVTVVESEGIQETVASHYWTLLDYRNALAGGAAGIGLAGFMVFVVTLRKRRRNDE
jgi:hypothetical protein